MNDSITAYYSARRRIEDSVGCISDEDIISKNGALILARGSKLSAHTVGLLEKHDINRIKSFKILGNMYSSEDEAMEDAFKKYRKAVKNVLKGNGVDVTVRDIMFEMLFMFHRLTFKSIMAYIQHVETIDNFTYSHSVNVAVLAVKIGALLGLREAKLKGLMEAGLFHDIGKVSTPSVVLNKKGRLTEEEFALIKRHPMIGNSMVHGLMDEDVCMAVLQHHEKLNGKGYPDGEIGGNINQYAKILSIADVFEALTAERPYKKKIPTIDSLKILRDMAFKEELDYSIVDRFTIGVMESMIGDYVKDGHKERMVIGFDRDSLELRLM